MKIIIFGATGTIGKHLVEQSLGNGYEVTAFTRNMGNLHQCNHPNLTKIEGDVFNSSDCQHATKCQDTVLIALGSGKSRKSIVRSEGTKNIIVAMPFCFKLAVLNL